MFNAEQCHSNDCVGNSEYDLADGAADPVYPEAVAVGAARAPSLVRWFTGLFAKNGAQEVLNTNAAQSAEKLAGLEKNLQHLRNVEGELRTQLDNGRRQIEQLSRAGKQANPHGLAREVNELIPKEISRVQQQISNTLSEMEKIR